MGDSDWFFKFMCELGTSGVWAKLSKAAKAVYPMLGIHTDGTFKPVFPSIHRLMKLTGLSKKGVADGLRNLEANGLIRRRSGKSHTKGQPNTHNIYEFRFEYPGSTLAYPKAKGLPTQRPSPLPTNRTPPCPLPSPEQDSVEPDPLQQQQQQPTVNLNLTVHHDQQMIAAVIDLLRKYFDEKAARHLAEKYPPDYIREKVVMVERRARSTRLRNKPGYLRRALEDGWKPSPGETDFQHFHQLIQSIRGGQVREAIVAGHPWRVGITADQRAIFLTHMTTGAQMRLDSWDQCRGIQWH